MEMSTLLEEIMWFGSMALVAILSFIFSFKLKNYETERAAMPKINFTEGSRLFLILGINYAVIAIACACLSMFSGPEIFDRIRIILNEWWLLELFIFFNLITSYCLYTAIKRVVVNV
jgi:hypothetical protein